MELPSSSAYKWRTAAERVNNPVTCSFQTAGDALQRHSNKKNRFVSPFFVDFEKHAAYQCKCDCKMVTLRSKSRPNEYEQRTRTWHRSIQAAAQQEPRCTAGDP